MQAMFDGKQREFHIDRSHVPFLEHSLGRGAYAVLKDFTDGLWTFHDVATVISLALHGPSKPERINISAGRSAAKIGLPYNFGGGHAIHTEVVTVLHREGHGNFADIAADILGLVIFGQAAEVVDG